MNTAAKTAYIEACEAILSAMAAYARTKDQAYAFRAYIAWRLAAPLKDEALSELQASLERESERAESMGYVRDRAHIPKVLQSIQDRFTAIEGAVFQALDEVAWARSIEPTTSARVAIDRFNVGALMGEAMRRQWKNGADQQTLLKAVARRMGLTLPNARKLYDQFLGEAKLTTTSRLVMDDLRAKLKARRKRPQCAGVATRRAPRKPKAWEVR